ncbi:MAG: DEAD/DEAH box helicase family protein [Mogibacterium sp.]|nr:DEAD/DEAH box helicase family protein [Mogibacterium sp.]MBR0341507.1 DEAD/DEAH box helicase family protein [Oscillospiraceae bacterium]
MKAPNIQSFHQVVPMIYAYTTPGVSYNDGWIKIGYTEKQSVEERVKQQTHTAGIQANIEWQDNAMYKDGSGKYFTDHDFHNYLEVERSIERRPKTEWFHTDGVGSLKMFGDFTFRRSSFTEADKLTYELRDEQQRAVQMTKEYFEGGGKEFLWNAKPRFGKTLSSYDLVSSMCLKKVLIVTNRPSIANSWAEDFRKFFGWREELLFVSETDALKGQPGVISRQEYLDRLTPIMGEEPKGMVAFVSLQDLKGSVYFGGEYDKLQWIHDNSFDMLIIDEAQEGVDTIRTDAAFRHIKRDYTLYLSGTPFKALASNQFGDNQIFNWTYADEQEAKVTWEREDYNPYEALPRMEMYTYQLSNMIFEKISRGLDGIDDEAPVDYAFDLNEFFATNDSGKFIHEEDIRKFLHALTTQEKYPFSTSELREELSHTLWILNRVNSVKALSKLLKDEEFADIFGDYEIVIAAGDGSVDEERVRAKAYNRVKEAIANNEKTITLSVGQLTVGVTIPEWSGVLMLCNLQSPSSYMQAAFRAQNPCIFTKNGQRMRKQVSYVFDFDPARTLIVFDEFANNLSRSTAAGRGTAADRSNNIKRLLNFFPVLGEDDEGEMVELDAAQVLSIPRKIKSQEVVRKGFMSNFLFQNISNIFGAPKIIQDIVGKLTPAQEEKSTKKDFEMKELPVDEDGEVDIPEEIIIGKTQDLFGDKIYEYLESDIHDQMDSAFSVREGTEFSAESVTKAMDDLTDALKERIKEAALKPAAEEYDIKKGAQNRIEKEINTDIDVSFDRLKRDFQRQTKVAEAERDRKKSEAVTREDLWEADREYKDRFREALEAFHAAAESAVKETIEEKPKEIVEKVEKQKTEEEKRGIEDDVRAHLRGFARTIPSFIMAYGDDGLTLANFDDYTEDDVFEEVTGISEADFRFLRDGGDYVDPDTGDTEHFYGHLFDEVVFNDSIKEFLAKKAALANYFDEDQKEDIFDYIPPQKTNQIFTPRWVVEKMVDQLEENNPGCFDDPTKTFADLYMKSGLYITEIVKRLFRSEGLKAAFPDEDERIRHILREQVYGMAPTRIIYLIATNFILGFDETLKGEIKNFVQCDAAEAAKNGELNYMVNDYFGM